MRTASIATTPINELEARTTTLSPEEAAKRLGVRVATLANWRWLGRGPRFLRVGRRIRYSLVDLYLWLEAHARTSASEPGSVADDASVGPSP